jgi:hydroxyacylglutathione hydrolase
MPFDIRTIPCLSDNYAFLARDHDTGTTVLVDVPDSAPILATLEQTGWTLDTVILTHHHPDHVQGLSDLLAAHPATVVGAQADAHRLPPLDRALTEGDSLTIGSQIGTVIDVSGHTVGHIAVHFPDAKVLFTADSLMALGCGRLFEGTPDMMWQSLSKLKSLPDDTLVYSGHEYTQSNARFAVTIEPDNHDLATRVADIDAARSAGKATVPSLLQLEKATNPFLRAHLPQVKAALGMPQATDTAVFTEIRHRKDVF